MAKAFSPLSPSMTPSIELLSSSTRAKSIGVAQGGLGGGGGGGGDGGGGGGEGFEGEGGAGGGGGLEAALAPLRSARMMPSLCQEPRIETMLGGGTVSERQP